MSPRTVLSCSTHRFHFLHTFFSNTTTTTTLFPDITPGEIGSLDRSPKKNRWVLMVRDFFTCRMPFLWPIIQYQRTERTKCKTTGKIGFVPSARQVTWLKERRNSWHPQDTTLTMALHRFTSDGRFSVQFSQETNEWTLMIRGVSEDDQGRYYCQVTVNDDTWDTPYSVELNVLGDFSNFLSVYVWDE